jgi:Rab-like protein 2
MTQQYRELQKYRTHLPTLVVANKIDVDYKVTQKKFQFAAKRKLPFYFCSAADGTNVVKVFEDAMKAAVQYKENPPADFTEDVMRTLDYFDEKEKRSERDRSDAEKKAKDDQEAAAAAAAAAAE